MLGAMYDTGHTADDDFDDDSVAPEKFTRQAAMAILNPLIEKYESKLQELSKKINVQSALNKAIVKMHPLAAGLGKV